MLKPFLLSGWFRLQPFVNYVVLVMLITPLVAVSVHSTSAKPSKAVTNMATSGSEFDSAPLKVASINEPYLVEVLTTSPIIPLTAKSRTMPLLMASLGEQSRLQNGVDSLLTGIDANHVLPFIGGELLVIPETPVSKFNLGQQFPQPAHTLHAKFPNELLMAKSLRKTPQQLPEIFRRETPVIEELDAAQVADIDPIGSPHPIPWKWIVATHEAISANGGSGVRYYRSVPVSSPDGRYIVYSRVQLEVKPEMYNSKVTSVMFLQDTQAKTLRVMLSTGPMSDPLLNTKDSSVVADTGMSGQIGVLVPVSWSEKGDRFLARKFKGKFNTGDSTDHAVIWDLQKNYINTVAPAREAHEHEKIAVLLGWSKNKPDHALFRSGEMGEENWPLVQVTTDGQTLDTTDADQPITFGQKITQVWPGPQFASR